jgi:hypothetical protein
VALSLRIINALMILFFIASGMFGTPSGGRTLANVISMCFGLAMLSIPLCMTIWVLGKERSVSHIRGVKMAHLIAQAFIICLAAFIAATGSSGKAGAMISLFSLPYLLNFIVLHKIAAARRKNREARKRIEPTFTAFPESATILMEERETRSEQPEQCSVASLVEEAHTQSAPVQPSRNYFVRHWRGELSLGISYWVNGTLISSGVGYAVILMVTLLMENMTIPVRQSAYIYIVMVTATILLWLWSIVGIWRSARLHPVRGGSKGWATAARVMVVIGSFSVSANIFTTLGPQISEFVQIAIGKDPLGKLDVKLTDNGQSVILKGALGEGSAKAVKKILNGSPQVKTVVLDSGGGRLREAEELALLIQSHKLNTYVERHCESACTYVFLAGIDRAATPNAKLGFHQPSFIGLDPVSQERMTGQMLEHYRKANLPDTFIRKIGRTSPDQMWYPDREELVLAKVITRISLGGETYLSGLSRMNSLAEIKLAMRGEDFWRAIEARFPDKADAIAAKVWETRQKGGNDTDIGNVLRSGMSGILEALLKELDGPMLDKFTQLSIDQMTAAKAVSPEACGKLLHFRLDVTHTLPKELAAREIQFIREALSAPPKAVNAGILHDSFDQGFQVVFDAMPPEDVQVFHRFTAHAGEPGKQCDAMISFYRSILKTDTATRHRMLSQIFQG